jgi:cell division protein FtsB
MKNLLELFNKHKGKVNKYWLTIVIFFTITFVFGDSRLQNRISYDSEIKRLNKEIEHYTRLKEDNKQKLNALQSDNETLEKLAREQYQMKKPNEDLFIIVE